MGANRKFGFQETAPEQVMNGIQFTPMIIHQRNYTLKKAVAHQVLHLYSPRSKERFKVKGINSICTRMIY